MRIDRDLRENAAHGDVFLPIAFYAISHMVEEPLHWHEEMEITRVTEGMALYQIDLDTVEVHEGDLIFVSPHTLHCFNQVGDARLSSNTFVFHLDLLGRGIPDACTNQYLQPIANGNLRLGHLRRPGEPGYQLLFESFLRLEQIYRENGAFFELALKAELFHFFWLLFLNGLTYASSPKTEDGQIREKLREVLRYMQENYKRSVTVEELAKQCHFSSYYFMRFFKKHLNMTCIEYMNQYRLARALEALESTDLPITSIALENGFNTVSYFNRQFKDKFHITPSACRKRKK
ncbi:MAG: AraC family transcriptional regulator [Ethanoligenens sp.]